MNNTISSTDSPPTHGKGEAAGRVKEVLAEPTRGNFLDAAAQTSTKAEDEPQPTDEGNVHTLPSVNAATQGAHDDDTTQSSGKVSHEEVQGVKSREPEGSAAEDKEESGKDEKDSVKDEASDDGSSQSTSSDGDSSTSAARDPSKSTLQSALDAAQDAFNALTAQLEKSGDKKTQELLAPALEKMARSIDKAKEVTQSAEAAVSKGASALTAQLEESGDSKTQALMAPAMKKMEKSVDKEREAAQSAVPEESSAVGKVIRSQHGATPPLSTSRPPLLLQPRQSPVPRVQGSVSGPDQLALARSKGRPIPPAVLECRRPKSEHEKLAMLSKQATWEFFWRGKAVKQWDKRCRVGRPEAGISFRQTNFVASPNCGESLRFPAEKSAAIREAPLTWDLLQQRTIANGPEGLAHMNMMLVHDPRHTRPPASERLPRPTTLRSIRNWHDEKAMRAAGKPLDKWTSSELREHRL